MSIIGTLPNTIANGDPLDATPVMADFNWIVSQVNGNAAPLSSPTFSGLVTLGGTLSVASTATFRGVLSVGAGFDVASVGLVPGTLNSGYVDFYSLGGVRQGYIGDSSTSSSADAGTLKYVAGTHAFTGNLSITGALSKGSGTFDIVHPIDSSKRLRHSFIEGPRYDLIYRGRVSLVNGSATVDLDTCGAVPMAPGTFVALTRDPDVFLNRDCDYELYGAQLTITGTTDKPISWMVIAERKDAHIMEGAGGMADADGNLILEYDR